MAFPGTYNFNYYRGDTFSFIIKPKNSNGDAFDLSSYTSGELFTIANKRGTGATQYSGAAIVDSVAGTITCTISATVGRNLSPSTSWVYDVQITDGTNIYTVLTGTITSTDDITGAV